MFRRTSTFAAVATLLTSTVATAQQREPFPGLDAYIAAAMADLKVPGAAIAIVRNDSVLYTKGYGVKEVGKAAPVDDHTLFEIGSASKTFTATLVGILQTDGKLRFDDKISRYLPDFRLYDSYATAEVTLRDALSHRTGLNRGELAWMGAGVPRAEIIRRLRFQPPATSFRSTWAYNNPMFLVAGEAAARAANSTWEDLIQQRIFTPLGMTESLPIVRDFSRYSNAAVPHGNGPSGSYAKDHMIMDNIAPAGSIVSDARDMAQWLRFQLSDGSLNGKRIISAAALRDIHTPQMVMPVGATGAVDPSTNFSTYGLGLVIQDYKGQLYWNHGGNTDGMTTAQAYLPKQELGVVVLANLDHTPLTELVARYVMDRQLKIPAQEWKPIAQRGGGRGNVQASRPPGLPALPLTAYTGTYADSLFGEAIVTVENDKLVIERGDWKGPMEHVSRDSFLWTVPGVAVLPPIPIVFEVGANGRATALSLGIQGDIRRFGRRR